MLLLVTIALVVAGAVSLVIGFVSNELLPIYISIGCSIVAFVVLVLFSRMSRRQPTAGAEVARPQPGWAPPEPPERPVVTRATSEPETAEQEPERTLVGAGVRRGAAPPPPPPREADVEEFPIEDYDALRVNEILPVLAELDVDELSLVREREEQGKRRATVLNRIDDLVDELEYQEEGPLEPEPAAPLLAPVEAEGPEPTAMAADGADQDGFPIAGYDELTADEILDLLDDLDDEELDMVAEREESGQNRPEILDRIDEMFEEIEDESEPLAPPAPPSKAAASKATAKKAGVKKATAKKAGVKKATAKKATAKKAGVKKATAKKAGVKKAPAKKAPAKKAGVKATAKKTPAKKAAAVRKR